MSEVISSFKCYVVRVADAICYSLSSVVTSVRVCPCQLIVVSGCAVSRVYINSCKCDMFSVVNVYHDHLKLCVVCINGRRYVCCNECNVVSNGCNEPTSCIVQPIGTHGGEVMCLCCMCVC